MSSNSAPLPHLANGDAVDGAQPPLHSVHIPSLDAGLPSQHAVDATSHGDIPGAPVEPAIVAKDPASAALQPGAVKSPPAGQVASGIQPLADFLPKDAPNLSHPTPSLDEPLSTVDADADIAMSNARDEAQPLPLPDAVLAPEPEAVSNLAPAQVTSFSSAESSLVRPREDDESEEPAAKRSKVDDEPRTEIPVADLLASEPPTPAPVVAPDVASSTAEPAILLSAPPTDVTAPQAHWESVIANAPRSSAAPESLPNANAGPTDAIAPEHAGSDLKSEPVNDVAMSEAAAPATQPAIPSVPLTEATAAAEAAPANPTAEPVQAAGASATLQAASQSSAPSDIPMDPATAGYDTRPLTTLQKNQLGEKMKNLKKTKNSLAFLRPVDPVALNLPTYNDVIKHPMDLATMENKLRDGVYISVQDFAKDFDLIINNTMKFNGPAHPVTVAGNNMNAYFRRMMETVSSADVTAPPPKAPKKRSPSLPRENRREVRNAAVAAAAAISPPSAPAPPPAVSPTSPTYALNTDGTPQLRRDSNRPQRAIKPPQNREITYAKPKRKEHQLELRFCEHVLDEVRSPKYGQMNHVFLQPVDPVALNIPHYRQIIKTPMDLSTMSQKLKGGQYSTAGEFKKDFDLIIKNCLLFNPAGNPVRDLGISFQRAFEALWANKSKWERQNQPPSNRASSASVDEDSGDEDEEMSEAEEDDKVATIRALQKQLAEMQNALSGLGGGKPVKEKKPKTGKSKKPSAGLPKQPKGAAKAPKAKKPKQVTYEEKQEISEAVGNMNEQQVARLTQIITSNCEKYRDMEEMELEIDDLPNDVQAKLLEYVRSIFGKPKRAARDASPDDAAAIDDDDFEPDHRARGGAGGKRKKHKPMGKKEQTDTIRSLEHKLAQFSNVGTSGSESPSGSGFHAAHAQADSSGDDESEESEEE